MNEAIGQWGNRTPEQQMQDAIELQNILMKEFPELRLTYEIETHGKPEDNGLYYRVERGGKKILVRSKREYVVTWLGGYKMGRKWNTKENKEEERVKVDD